MSSKDLSDETQNISDMKGLVAGLYMLKELVVNVTRFETALRIFYCKTSKK